MMAKPMKTLELHYPMIQFLITAISHPETLSRPNVSPRRSDF